MITVPAPPSTKEDASNKINDGGNNQKLILFNLGNRFIRMFSQTVELYLQVTNYTCDLLTCSL